MGDSRMSRTGDVTAMERQKQEYKECLDFFSHCTKEWWVHIAEHYDRMRSLPDCLWYGDALRCGVERPTVARLLKAKFGISEGRMSQYAGAYKARQELKGEVDGYDRLSCDALYEIYRFANGKGNADGLSIKDVYEAVRTAKGAVTEKTVKEWRNSPLRTTAVDTSSQCGDLLQRLSQLIEEAKGIVAQLHGQANS